MLNHLLNKDSLDREEMPSIHRYFVHLIAVVLMESEERNIDVGQHEVYQRSTTTTAKSIKKFPLKNLPVVQVSIVDRLYQH